MGNSLYLFLGFGSAWVIIFLYFYSMDRKQKTLEAQINKMRIFLEKIQPLE